MSNKLFTYLHAAIIISLLIFLFIMMYSSQKSKILLIPMQSKHFKHILNRTNQSSLHLLSEHSPLDIAIINRNRTFPVNYFDPKFLGDCYLRSPRKEIFTLLKLWSEFAGQHNIMWFLQYGTLIGAIRHQDAIPWDSDADIAIYQIDEPLIRKLATPRPITNYSIPNLVVRPGAHCPYNGPRQDCQGKNVSSQSDGCAFCGPLARYFFRPSVRIDLYVVNIEQNGPKGELAMSDEGMWEYSEEKTYYPLDDYLPLTVCNYINLTVPCPKYSKQLLNRIYTSYEARYRCEKADWVKI